MEELHLASIMLLLFLDALVEELREKSIDCNMSAEHNNMVFLALLEAQKYKLLLEDSMNNLTGNKLVVFCCDIHVCHMR